MGATGAMGVTALSRDATPGSRLRRRARTILVVEDDPWLSELLVLLLEGEGHRVVAVADGGAVAEAAVTLRPDLITLDLGLPVIDGQAVLERLAAETATASIPVVVLSADVADLRPTRQVKEVLVKPRGIERLAETVRRLLGQQGQGAGLAGRGPA